MQSDVLGEWNPWWEKKPEFGLVERDIKDEILKWLERKEIIGILGVRRGGKTSLLYLIIKHLLNSADKRNILFIKCDDDRVEKKGLIEKSIEMYKELLNPKGRVFIFIDEVQEVPEWESTLKRIYDLEKNVKFFISGSNFSALKEDLTYKLAGRLAYFDLYPFSFREMLKMKMNINEKIFSLSKKREIKHFLLQYIEFGGFPEIVLEGDEMKKRQLLQFYYDTIVYRDVIKRRGVRNATNMERMINYFLQNISNKTNFSAVGKTVSLSTDSVVEYTKYLQDAFFIFSIPLFSHSVKKQEINPKKIYCIDTGMRNVKGFRFSEDFGRLAENTAFIEIKRRESANPLSEVFYWEGEKCEVDFVLKEGIKVKELIQVCWDIENKETKKREVGGLLEALKHFRLKKGLIITENFEGQEKVNGKTIEYIPLWKWLLQ